MFKEEVLGFWFLGSNVTSVGFLKKELKNAGLRSSPLFIEPNGVLDSNMRLHHEYYSTLY